MTETTEQVQAVKETPNAGDVIRGCLNRIRRRLFVVRALERVAVALMMAAGVGAAFVMARYLRPRFEFWAMAAAMVPALVVGIYWLMQMFGGARRGQSAFCSKVASILTVALVTAAVGLFATMYWAGLPMWAFAAAPLAVFAVSAIFAGRQVSAQAAAIFVDQQAGLEERVSTAYEMLHRDAATPEESRFQAPLVASAVEACQQVRKARVGYSRLDRRVYLASAVCAAAAIGVTFIQPLPALATRVAVKTDPRVPMVASELAKEAEKLAERHGKDLTKDPALKPLQTLIQEIKDGDGTKLETFEAIARAKAAYEKELDGFKSAENIEGELKKNSDLGPLADKIQQYKTALENETKSGDSQAATDARNQAERDLAAAAKDVAQKMADGKLSDSEKAGLAKALEEAGKAAGNDPDLQRAIAQAKDALANGDSGKLESSLKDIGSRVGSSLAEKSRNEQTDKDVMGELNRQARNVGQNGSNDPGSSGGAGQTAMGNGNSGESGNKSGGNPSGENPGSQAGNNPGGGQPGGNQSESGNDKRGGENPGGSDMTNAGNDPGNDPGSQPGEGSQGTGSQANGGGEQPGEGAGGAGSTPGSEAGTAGSGSTQDFSPGGPGGKYHGGEIGGVGVLRGGEHGPEIKTAGGTAKAGSKIGEGAPSGSSNFMATADKGALLTGYDRAALESARKANEGAVQTSKVPPAYRDLVKNFYGGGTQPK